MRIVTACDNAYAPHAAALAASLRVFAPGRETVLLYFPESLTAENRDRIGMAETVAADPARFAALPARGHITRSAYLRMAAAQLLPDDMILYLDADTIAMDDLSPLLDAAYSDGFYLYASEEAAADFKPLLGFSADDPYFNSGVMVMDLARMRRDRLTEAFMLRSLECGDRQLFHDQDTMNAVLRGRFGVLAPRWNVNHAVADPRYWPQFTLHSAAELDAARRAPGIVHFSYGKPWEYGCDHPFRGAYWRFRRLTAWPNGRPAGFTWSKWYWLWRNRLSRALCEWRLKK